MANVPRPGMPQSEKDRLGQALHEQRLREDRIARGELSDIQPIPDEALDSRTKPELLKEADRLGVDVRSGATKDEILAALRGEGSNDGKDVKDADADRLPVKDEGE